MSHKKIKMPLNLMAIILSLKKNSFNRKKKKHEKSEKNLKTIKRF